MRRWIATLAFCLVAGRVAGDPAPLATPVCHAGSERLARVELFFGVSRRKNEKAAWRRFLSGVVSPRFPEGFTVVNASGQWREPNGLVDREASRIVLVLYRRDETSDRKIEAIRSAYKVAFKQRSVLRVDSDICAAF